MRHRVVRVQRARRPQVGADRHDAGRENPILLFHVRVGILEMLQSNLLAHVTMVWLLATLDAKAVR